LAGCDARPPVAGGARACPASALSGRVAVSGRASWTAGDESGAATAGVGGDARQPQRAPREYHGNSRGVGRLSDRTALSRDSRTAGVSLSRLGRHGDTPTAGSWTDRGTSPRCRASGAMVPGRCQRAPPARLCEWRRGDWQDDGGRPRAGPSHGRERGAERAGAVCRALCRGGAVPCTVTGRGTALPRPSGAGDPGRAPALCTDVARAIPRAGGREGPGRAATPGARGDARADAARTGPGARGP